MAADATPVRRRPVRLRWIALLGAALLWGWGLAGTRLLWPRFEEQRPLDPAVEGRSLASGAPVPKGFGVFSFRAVEPVKRVAIRDWATRKLAWYVDDPRQGSQFRVALRPAYYVFEHYTDYAAPVQDDMATFTVKDGADADEFTGADELPIIDPPDPALAGVTLRADEAPPPGASVIRYTVQDKIDRLILRLLTASRAIVWHLDRPAFGTYQIVLPPGPYSLEQHSPVLAPWSVPPRVIYEVMLAAHEQKAFTSKDVSPVY